MCTLLDPSSEGINNENGFCNLGVRIEDIKLKGTVVMTDERVTNVWAGEDRLAEAPCRASVSIDHIPDLGPLDLTYCGPGRDSCTVAGMRVELARRRDREVAITIDGGGPHTPDEDRLVEMENIARKIRDFFGTGGPIELGSCSIAGYFHIDLETYMDILQGCITRATGRRWDQLIPHPVGEMLKYKFGSASGGRRVTLSSYDGDKPLPSGGVAYAGLKSHYQEGCDIMRVELAFEGPFIRRIAVSTNGEGSQPNLARLLQDLVRATLGDETLPNSFFRAATLESRNLPDSLRPNSASWESVRRAFLDAVAVSRLSPDTEANS